MDNVGIEQLPRNQSVKRALALHKRFWSVQTPPSVLRIRDKRRRDKRVFVSLGASPSVHISAGPKHRPGKQTRIVHSHRMLICKPNGKGVVIWNTRKPLPRKPRLRFAGWVPTTEYIATRDIDRANSPKKQTRWQHSHSDSNGCWPKLYRDQFGNWYYKGGTLRVARWLYR